MKAASDNKLYIIFVVGILRSLSLLTYFIEPILIWTFKTKLDMKADNYFLVSEATSAAVALILFFIPLLMLKGDKVQLSYLICKKAIWTAIPGIIVVTFWMGIIIESLGYRIGLIGFIMYTTAWFVPLYVILMTPTQTRMFIDVLRQNLQISKSKALTIAISLTLLPFIGVSIIKYIFYVLRDYIIQS